MSPATILLIDSDADSLAIYSMILEHHGYQVLHARDAETGLRLAFESQPDLVVSELVLPPLHTGEVVYQLRQDRRTAATPLIILDSVPTLARDLWESGANLSRLTKPCKPSRLLEEIQRLMNQPLSMIH